MYNAEKQKRHPNFTEAIFAALALLVLALVWFQWDMVNIITVFLMLPYYVGIGLIVIGMAIASIILLFKERGKRPLLRRFTPVLITAALVLSLWFIPFTQLYLQLDYQTKLSGREEVVRLIESGELDFDGKTHGRVSLPPKYANLSKSGDVLIHFTDSSVSVFFFAFSGVLDNFSGYVYVSDDTEAGIRRFVYESDINEVEKQQDCWYWVSST